MQASKCVRKSECTGQPSSQTNARTCAIRIGMHSLSKSTEPAAVAAKHEQAVCCHVRAGQCMRSRNSMLKHAGTSTCKAHPYGHVHVGMHVVDPHAPHALLVTHQLQRVNRLLAVKGITESRHHDPTPHTRQAYGIQRGGTFNARLVVFQ